MLLGSGSRVNKKASRGWNFFLFTGEQDLRFYAVNKKNFSRGERRSVVRGALGGVRVLHPSHFSVRLRVKRRTLTC